MERIVMGGKGLTVDSAETKRDKSISHCQALPQHKLDEWADLKDPAERRKIQNRVHQRSLRKYLRNSTQSQLKKLD